MRFKKKFSSKLLLQRNFNSLYEIHLTELIWDVTSGNFNSLYEIRDEVRMLITDSDLFQFSL